MYVYSKDKSREKFFCPFNTNIWCSSVLRVEEKTPEELLSTASAWISAEAARVEER